MPLLLGSIFTAISLLALFRPRLATIVVVALLPTYIFKTTILGLPTNILEIAIAGLVLGHLLRFADWPQWHTVWQHLPRTLLILILLFLAASIISTAISPHPTTSLGILKGWVFIPLILSAIAFYHLTNQPNNSTPHHLITSLTLSGTAVALIGLTQLGTQARLTSLYDVPASLALYLTPIIILNIFIGRWWQYVAAIIMSIALLATQSVSGIIAVLTTIIISLVIIRPRYSLRLFLIIALITIIAIVTLTISGRLSYLVQPTTHNSISVRLQLWSVATELIKQNPLLGTGLGTFEPAYQEKLHQRFAVFENCKLKIENCTQPTPEFVFRDPHSWPLSFWLNAGLLGLISFTSLNIWIIKKAFSNQQPAIALAIISLLLYGLTDTIYWKNDLATLHWLLIALAASYVSLKPNSSPQYVKTYRPTPQ